MAWLPKLCTPLDCENHRVFHHHIHHTWLKLSLNQKSKGISSAWNREEDWVSEVKGLLWGSTGNSFQVMMPNRVWRVWLSNWDPPPTRRGAPKARCDQSRSGLGEAQAHLLQVGVLMGKGWLAWPWLGLGRGDGWLSEEDSMFFQTTRTPRTAFWHNWSPVLTDYSIWKKPQRISKPAPLYPTPPQSLYQPWPWGVVGYKIATRFER